MAVRKPGEAAPFTPPSELERPEDERVSYRLRTPVLYDDVKLKRAITAKGAKEQTPATIILALRRDIQDLTADRPEEERGRLLGIVDAKTERLKAFYKRVQAREFDMESDKGRAAFFEALQASHSSGSELQHLEDLVRQAGGLYATALADDAVYLDILGIEAARLFVVGWKNLLASFVAGDESGLADETLLNIPAAHRQAIGVEVRRLVQPDEDARKNSAGPLSGTSKKKSSTAKKKPRRKHP